MDRNRRKLNLALSAGMLPLLMPSMARASNDFPNRPFRVIVPFTPGSGSDSVSRFFGEQMSKALGQPFVVENRTGAGGSIAAKAVKSAPADGYTILLGNISLMTVNPVLMKDPGYSPLKDFKPLSGLAVTVGALVVPLSSPIQSVQDLMAAARARPMNFGTFSPAYHLASAYLGNLAGVTFTNIAYKGQAPLSSDVLGGQLDTAFFDVSGTLPLLQSKRVRVLAITGRKRNEGLPDVPTLRELGYPDYAHESWMGFFTRAETPADVSARLAGALQEILKTEPAREYARKSVVELFPQTPEQLSAFIDSEISRFQRVARMAGIEAE